VLAFPSAGEGNAMTTTTNVTRARKSIEERLQDMRARLEGLEKRKHEQERRDLQRLKLRLGSAAVAAGFAADWTDAQVERAMAAAVKTHDASKAAAPVALPKAPEASAAKASAPAVTPVKTAAPVGVKP
jgi:hypothetical protein